MILGFTIISYSQGREIHGYFAQVQIPTNDSICFDAICVKAGPTGNKILVELDSTAYFNIVKVGVDQTLGVRIYYRVYENYYAYGHYRSPLKQGYITATGYDVFGAELETTLYQLIKTKVAQLFNVPESKVTVSSFYYNYPQ